MKYSIFSIAFLVLVFACQRKTPAATGDKGIPTCIQHKIDSIKKEPVWNPPAEIHEYEYEGKRVYLISADCCDFFTIAVDTDCNYVCAPSGGITGRGDGKCKEFGTSAKMIRVVWKDDRVRR
jgi:hypothetical protein